MGIDQPAATRTFLLTDIEGSTRLWEDHREAMAPALEAHDRLLAAAVGHAGGIVVKSTGDGLLAVFEAVDAAIGAALEGQRSLAAHGWGGSSSRPRGPTSSPCRTSRPAWAIASGS